MTKNVIWNKATHSEPSTKKKKKKIILKPILTSRYGSFFQRNREVGALWERKAGLSREKLWRKAD